MYSITANGTNTYKTDLKLSNSLFEGTLNGKLISGDFLKINDYQFHIL